MSALFKRFWILLRVLFKSGDVAIFNSASMMSKKKKRGGLFGRFGGGATRSSGQKDWLSYLVMILAFGYLIYISFCYGAGLGGLDAVTPDLRMNFYGLLLPMICMMNVVFGFVYLVSAFYHSPNTSTLLSMPFGASEIVLARFVQVGILTFLMSGCMIYPALIGYGVRAGLDAGYYVRTALVGLFFAPVSLGLPVVLIMLLMRFTRFFRNKDRFTIVSTFLMIVAILGFMYGIMGVQNGGRSIHTPGAQANPESADIYVKSGISGKLGAMNWIFFGLRFAYGALSGDSAVLGVWGATALFILCSIGWLAISMIVGAKVYIPGVAAGSGNAMRVRRKLNKKEIRQLGRRRSAFGACLRRDLHLLLRTPAYLMNNILMAILFPLMVLIPLFVGVSQASESGISKIRGSIGVIIDRMPGGFEIVMFYATLMSLGIGLFCSGSNMLTSIAVSREGSNAWIMNLLPVSLEKQLMAKFLIGCLFSLSGPFVILLVATLFLGIPFQVCLPLFVLLLISIFPANLLGLVVDMRRPRLNWTDEIQVSKQSMNAFIEMFGSILLAGIGIYGLLKLHSVVTNAWVLYGVALTYVLLVSIILYILFKASLRRCAQLIALSN